MNEHVEEVRGLTWDEAIDQVDRWDRERLKDEPRYRRYLRWTANNELTPRQRFEIVMMVGRDLDEFSRFGWLPAAEYRAMGLDEPGTFDGLIEYDLDADENQRTNGVGEPLWVAVRDPALYDPGET